MFSPSDRPSSLLLRALVVIQVFLLVATLFAPISVSAADESPDPSASAPASSEPSAAPDPTATPDPTPEPPAATPDPTPEPPAATPEPTVEPPAATPEPTSDPTTEPSTAPSTEPSAPVGTPTIESDQEDYAAGATVTLTGTGWQPGESVHIYVNDDFGSSWSRNVDVTADDNGAIHDQFELPIWFVAVYSVVATGDTSGVATTAFTDSRTITSATLNGGSAVTVVAGGSITAVVNVTTDNGGGNSNWRSTAWRLATTPPGTLTCVDHANHNAIGSFTESFTITAPAAAGTYNAYFIAYSDDGCSNQPSGQFTLSNGVVAQRATTTVVSTSGTPSVFGSTVTFTATVTATGGNPSGVGTVEFKDGTTVLCAAAALTLNVATCAVSTLTVAGSPHTITGQYSGTTSGSPQFAPSAVATLAGGQTVTKASSTTTVTCPASVTYTGSPLTPCTATVTGAGGLSLTPTPTHSSNTNAGTASATFTYGGDANHNGSTDTKTFTIAKAGSTTTVSCPASVTFTGSALTPCTATATGVGGLNQSLTVSYSNNTNVGTANASATFGGDSNHNGSAGSATFAIGKASSTTTVTCPASITYTGSPLTPCSGTVTGVGGLSQILAVAYTDNTNAGTASASSTFGGDANHFGSNGSATFTIGKATSTTTVSCPAGPYTYTGAAQTPCSATVTGAGGLNLTPTPTYTDNTNAGTATASYIYPGDANHFGSNGSATFTIGKAGSTTTVTCPASVTYDGSALTPCSATATGVGGLNESLTVVYADNTDAGTASAGASFGGDANHEPSSDDTTFEIAKAASTVTVDCPDSVTYDGSAQEPCTANVTGAGGLNETLTVLYADNTDAGTASASASYAGDANHEPATGAATFEIEKASSTTVLTCPTSVTYTGLALQPCTATVTGDGGLNQGLTVLYSDNTDAGTAPASATYAGDANHEGSSDSTTFEIDKADSTVGITCPTSVTYTSFAQEPCTASATGAGMSPVDVTDSIVYTNNIDAGTAGVSASYDGDANHKPSSSSTSFDIDPASLTVDFSAADKTYDATAAATITACSVGTVLGDDEVTCDDTGATAEFASANAGNPIVTGTGFALAGDDADNYVIVATNTTTATIDKADPTIVVTPYDVTYDANSHSATASAKGVLDEGLVGLDLSATTHTNAGTYVDGWTFTDLTGNYNDASGSVTDKIAKADASIDVTPYDVTYDGAPHTATGSATGVLDEDLTGLDLSGTTHTNAGTYTDAWTFTDVTGNYNNATGSVTDNIDKADATVQVTGYDVVFDGDPHTADGSAKGVLGETLTGLDLSATTHTNAGTYSGDAWTFTDATGNYNDTAGTVDDQIDQAPSVTTVTCPVSVVYDGSAQEPCSADVTGAGGLDELLAVLYANNTDAGTASASASYDGDANHFGSDDDTTFEIDKAASFTTVTCPAGPYTYDGTAQTPCSATVTGAGGLDLAPTPDYSDNVNAGVATASYIYAGDDNHFGSDDSDTFTIDKASSTTVVTCPTNVTYTGSPFVPCSGLATGAGGLSQILAVDYTDNTDAGVGSASSSFPGDDNHTGSNDSETFTIDKADSVTTVTCPAGPYTFNGFAQTPCSATVTGAGSLNEAPSPDYADNVNAGTATASYTFAGDANHNGSDDSDTFTIDQAPSFTTVTCPVSVVYDGSAQEPCSADVTGAGGLDESLTVLYADNTDAGTASASASYDGDANHFGSVDDTTFEIDKADSTTVVMCLTGPHFFTGLPQTPCSASVTGAGGLDQPLTVGYLTNTNAGTATASAAYGGDANHNSSNDAENFTIDKAGSTTVVTCPTNVTYTGSPIVPCSGLVTGAGSLSVILAVTYTDNTNAGTAHASSSFAGDANHTGSGDTETFTIEKAGSTTTVTCPVGPYIFTGSAHTPCSATVTGAGGLSLNPTPTYANNTNAGTATASYAYAGDPNHVGSNDSETFEIGQATSATVVTCPANVTYTGAPRTPCTASVTGVGGLSQPLGVSHTNNTNAGTANASASFAGDANHSSSSDSKTFTIDKAPSAAIVSCPVGPYTYNGSAQMPCSASVTGAGGLSQALTPSYTANTNAGTATANASYGGDANHMGSSGSATFTIGKATSSTVVTCPVSVMYNGSAQVPCSGLATGAGGLSQIIAVTYGNNTNAGTASASASFGGDANHYGSNDSKTFTIAKAGSTTSITCPASVVYTGAALTPCSVSVTGAGGLNMTPAATYANNVMVGTASASHSFAGDLNHTGSSNSKNFQVTTAFRIIGFDSPVDMTLATDATPYWNSVKGGQTVPLKFRVYNLNGTEVTSIAGLSAWASSVACISGDLDPTVLPTELASNTGLMRTGDRFHFNWAVPKTAGKCYQVYIKTPDGSTVMVASMAGAPELEAYFKSK